MPAALSGRILREARAQQEELDAEAVPAVAAALAGAGGRGLVAAAAKGLRDSDSDDDDDFSGAALARGCGLWGGVAWATAASAHLNPSITSLSRSCRPPRPPADGSQGYEYEEEIEVSPEDEAALAAFMAPDADAYHQCTLADLILDKIRQKQAEQGVAELPRWATGGGVLTGGLGLCTGHTAWSLHATALHCTASRQS